MQSELSITLESKGAIAEARAYDALTDAQKAQVSNTRHSGE